MSKVELEPYLPVLVRDTEVGEWTCSFFSHIRKYENGKTAYICINENTWNYCLPYEGNEHLLGTTNSPTPPEPEFRWGDHVEVQFDDSGVWIPAIYYGFNRQGKQFGVILSGHSTCSWVKNCRHSDW